MTREQLERAFRTLLREHEQRADNPGCIACEGCERCRDCTFCKRSTGLVRCHYCVESERCIDSTHCRDCADLLACNHCHLCSRCTRSAYLEGCVDCSDCCYCFASVGLSGAEFCILNEPHDRQTYFAKVAELARHLPALRWR